MSFEQFVLGRVLHYRVCFFCLLGISAQNIKHPLSFYYLEIYNVNFTGMPCGTKSDILQIYECLVYTECLHKTILTNTDLLSFCFQTDISHIRPLLFIFSGIFVTSSDQVRKINEQVKSGIKNQSAVKTSRLRE